MEEAILIDLKRRIEAIGTPELDVKAYIKIDGSVIVNVPGSFWPIVHTDCLVLPIRRIQLSQDGDKRSAKPGLVIAYMVNSDVVGSLALVVWSSRGHLPLMVRRIEELNEVALDDLANTFAFAAGYPIDLPYS